MRIGVFVFVPILLFIFLLRGGELVGRAGINKEMLVASSRISRDGANICPALRISNEDGLEDIFKRLENSGLARLQQILGLYFFAAHDASAAWRTLESANNNSPVDEFWLGCAAYANGDLQRAVAAWRRAKAAQYFVNYGAKMGTGGNNADAIRFYSIASQIAPGDANAWLGLAQYQLNLAYLGKVSWQATLDSAERALALAPENLQAHFLVGSALLGGKTDLPRAAQELRFVFTQRGGWIEEYVLADALLGLGQVAEATALLEHALQVRDGPVVRFHLVRAYLAAGRCSLGIESMQDALLRYPDLQSGFENLCRGNSTCPCNP